MKVLRREQPNEVGKLFHFCINIHELVTNLTPFLKITCFGWKWTPSKAYSVFRPPCTGRLLVGVP